MSGQSNGSNWEDSPAKQVRMFSGRLSACLSACCTSEPQAVAFCCCPRLELEQWLCCRTFKARQAGMVRGNFGLQGDKRDENRHNEARELAQRHRLLAEQASPPSLLKHASADINVPLWGRGWLCIRLFRRLKAGCCSGHETSTSSAGTLWSSTSRCRPWRRLRSGPWS